MKRLIVITHCFQENLNGYRAVVKPDRNRDGQFSTTNLKIAFPAKYAPFPSLQVKTTCMNAFLLYAKITMKYCEFD